MIVKTNRGRSNSGDIMTRVRRSGVGNADDSDGDNVSVERKVPI